MTGDHSDSRIQRGFEIAPVPLNREGKNPALVGLGSYIVNTEGCNDCHSAGPLTEHARGGDPYFGQPKKVNAATYLGGGRDFLTVSGPPSPHIISRNLTPTPSTGLPGGTLRLSVSSKSSSMERILTSFIRTVLRLLPHSAFRRTRPILLSMAAFSKSYAGPISKT
jgi:hypothetical protein